MQLEGESALRGVEGRRRHLHARVLAREVAGYGITCQRRGHRRRSRPTSSATCRKDKIGGYHSSGWPIKRLGRFEDVANVIDFFVRPAERLRDRAGDHAGRRLTSSFCRRRISLSMFILLPNPYGGG
jgi:NAD(P)-dependent dehydrogenase (short-subunit alcohol dehydrogenase family)